MALEPADETEMRDSVSALAGEPTIISISDVHGYLDAAQSALSTLSDHPDFTPLVEQRTDGALHWAGDNEYALVYNGDMINRGPDSAEVLSLIERLREEAPPGHVRHNIGNHEMGLFFQDATPWDGFYADTAETDVVAEFYEAIFDKHVTVAYEGYNYTYVHAGAPDRIDATALNDELARAARTLADALCTPEAATIQQAVWDEHEEVFGTGPESPTGVLWVRFDDLPADAPPQVVGHTRHDEVTRKGNVVCGDVILENLDSPGGEAVLVETPDSLTALVRESDGSVSHSPLD